MNSISPKLFVGPMSKTVVDACIEYSNDTGILLGLIPSRRQIDMSSGYVNGWNTDSFAGYVRERSNNITIQRDHGGCGQGDVSDDGLTSLEHDANHFDMLHIDPFKNCKTIDSAAVYTSEVINNISEFSECEYEIGTEEAIFKMTISEAEQFFESVKNKTGNNFNKVKYLVVQFGTKIIGNENTGHFDKTRANEMIGLCKSFGKLSKEHNGDYLSANGVSIRRALGLNALNIAPEMGGIETVCLLEEIESKQNLIDSFVDCCISSNRWQKWFPADFDPLENKLIFLQSCGHYCFSMPAFKKICDCIDHNKVISDAKNRIKNRIAELL